MPSNLMLFRMFFSMVASAGAFYFSLWNLEAPFATYLDNENSDFIVSVMSAIVLASSVAIPIATDNVERQGDAVSTVQLCAGLTAGGIILFMIALSFKSVPVLYLATAAIAFPAQITCQGVLFVLVAKFLTVERKRSGSMSAIAVCSANFTCFYLFFMGTNPVVTANKQGEAEVDLFPLTVVLLLVLAAWVSLLNLPRGNFKLSNFIPKDKSARKAGLCVSIGSATRGFFECLFTGQYRRLLIVSLCSGAFMGTSVFMTPLLVYYAEDYVGTSAVEGLHYLFILTTCGSIASGVILIPLGMVIDRIGSMPAVYLGCFGMASVFASLELITPSLSSIQVVWLLFPFPMALFLTGLIPYVVDNILPNEQTIGRDVCAPSSPLPLSLPPFNSLSLPPPVPSSLPSLLLLHRALASPRVSSCLIAQVGMLGALVTLMATGLTVALGKFVEYQGSTPSGTNLGGREKYSQKAYHYTFYLTIGIYLVLPLLIHLAGSALKRRVPPKQVQFSMH